MDDDSSLDAESSGHKPVIAASVDSSLAGLLGSVLATSRAQSVVEPPAQPAPPAQPVPAAEPEPPATGQPVWQADVVPETITPPARPAGPPDRMRLRQAVEEGRKRRVLSAKQLTLMLEGLSLLRARPGEEGLPPAMLMLDIRVKGSMLPGDGLYAIRTQIDKSVRSGDVALVVPDLGVLLFCGGLFFPGDLEVMGARIRRRALDRPTSFVADEVRVVVAGALSMSGEDPISFINRGVTAFEDSIEYDRQDILIDYGGQPSEFLF
jgi:hypothetical protein